MTEEKQIVLKKIDNLLAKRTAELIKELPDVHEVSDGIIIRFFGEWDNCEDNEIIRYKEIENLSDENETVLFIYLPKGAIFDLKERLYIDCVTCLNGKVEIETATETIILKDFNKMCLNNREFQGEALENTYLITTGEKILPLS